MHFLVNIFYTQDTSLQALRLEETHAETRTHKHTQTFKLFFTPSAAQTLTRNVCTRIKKDVFPEERPRSHWRRAGRAC